MKNTVAIFKLLSDETRVRILMLLTRKELCVCQLMGVLGISQPLVSRNLSLLSRGGVLKERREGKMIFYSLKEDVPALESGVIEILKRRLKNDPVFKDDLKSLADCTEYQKKTGKCDMTTFLEFMKRKGKQKDRREIKSVNKT